MTLSERKIFIVIFINLLNKIFSVVPIWDFYKSSIDLLSSDSSHPYSINGFNCQISKKIEKNSGEITYKKYLNFGGNDKGEVDFEDATYFSSTVFGVNNVICPRGKFHPYEYGTDNNVNSLSFTGGGDWDLKCFGHSNGWFYIFYLNNKKDNLFAFKNSNTKIKQTTYFGNELYDFILQDGYSTENDHGFPLAIIYWDSSGYITLRGAYLIMNSNQNFINKKDRDGMTKDLISAKNYSQAYFTSDYNFHYFTYNDVSDFLGGYSTSPVNSNDYSDVSNVQITNHNFSPIEFLNEVEINYIKFISGTKYAYYEINDNNSGKKYHGIMDIEKNKVLFNTDEDIKTFVPYSNSEMLAITAKSAYKICIFKNNDQCSETCDDNKNLILDIDGNKCDSNNDCNEGKIKLMPNNICVYESFCDLKIFIKNETHCGLCKEFYPDTTPYKLYNTTGCISSIPSNSISYNSNTHLKIYKCKELFHPFDNNRCVPDFCYEKCLECYEASNDENDQKCLTCKEGYYLDQNNNNCIK